MRKLLFIVAGCLPLSAFADTPALYSWKDASGLIHYADQPPPGVNAKLVHPAEGGGQQSATPAPNAAPAASDSGEDCQKQKDKLAAYNGAASITETDSLGAKHEYTPEERQKLLDLTQEKVLKACSPSS